MKFKTLSSLLLLSNTVFANNSPLNPVKIFPISKADYNKYEYNPNEYWVKGTDIVDNFSIEDAKKFYKSLFTTISKNFVKKISFKEITNKIFESLSVFSEKISIETTDKRILIYDKNFKLLANFPKVYDEENIENLVNALINTILHLRKDNKQIGNAHQEQIYYITALYLLQSLDENANYIDPVTFLKIQSEDTSKTFGFSYRRIKDGIQITNITKNSPIFHTNIKSGDLITHLNELKTKDLTDEQIEYFLTNPEIDIVHINYISYITNKQDNLFLRKNKLYFSSIDSNINDNIQTIIIHNFNKNTINDINETINKNQNISGYIIDLRTNANGDYFDAINTANLFIENKTSATIKRDNETIETFTSKTDIVHNKPIVVIIDNTTNGPAEIFTSLLQGVNRAVIIGTPSFGNGLIHQSYTLANNSQITFSTAELYNAKNDSPKNIGIVPIICTSHMSNQEDIEILKNNIKNGKFKDNRPDIKNVNPELINNIRKACPALYPTIEQHNLNNKIATEIIKNTSIYNSLIFK